MKLKRSPINEITQLDGFEEVTKEAETQTTETKPETRIKATQIGRASPVFDVCQVQQTNIPAEPRQPPRTNMGPYLPPHSR